MLNYMISSETETWSERRQLACVDHLRGRMVS